MSTDYSSDGDNGSTSSGVDGDDNGSEGGGQ